jgi:hypothetical protein
MNFFKKFIASITGYLVLYAQVAATIGRIAADFFRDRWARLRQMPLSEQAFALLTVLLAFFTFVPWRAYKIRFGDDERKHGIYSDDFAIILVRMYHCHGGARVVPFAAQTTRSEKGACLSIQRPCHRLGLCPVEPDKSTTHRCHKRSGLYLGILYVFI